MPLEETFVTSSTILSVCYDNENRILEVKFKNNSIYQYFEVEKNIYESLIAATSHGKYLHTEIIKKNYTFKKIQ